MPKGTTDRDRARGARLKQIRAEFEGLDHKGEPILTQADMVEILNKAATALGLSPIYSYFTVSRCERRGPVDVEQAATWLRVDPRKRGWDWLVFGKGEETHIKPSIVSGQRRHRRHRGA